MMRTNLRTVRTNEEDGQTRTQRPSVEAGVDVQRPVHTDRNSISRSRICRSGESGCFSLGGIALIVDYEAETVRSPIGDEYDLEVACSSPQDEAPTTC